MTSLCLYIHVPFCKQKCSYCDFVSYAGKEELIDFYVNALINESQFLLSTFNSQLSTIYLGGGTPTLLEPKYFERILKTLESGKSKVDSRKLEVTIEANPGTVDLEYLKALHSLGINRISFGAQSFNDAHLKTLGRIHSSKQIYEAFDAARKAGFENINIDLIFAIPNQTLDEWKDDLQKAVSLNPEHLSTYNLQIEEGTPFFERVAHHASRITSDDLDADMYEFTMDYLKYHRYKHYEISNFAKPGFECRHNINYWGMGNWIGVGAGAHSYVNGKHWANAESVEEYIRAVMVTKPVSSKGDGFGRTPKTTTETGIVTAQRETLFMGLRLLDGLESSKFSGFEKEVADLKKENLIEESNGKIRLTKHGLMLGNLVFEKFV